MGNGEDRHMAPIQWTDDFATACHQAGQDQKLVLLDFYHWNGYFPPAEFLPQLLVAQAHACLRLHDEPGAVAVYREVLERFPTSTVAPEAQYFFAVSAYKQSHQASDLLDNWHRLQMRYPASLWRVKQSFAEEG